MAKKGPKLTNFKTGDRDHVTAYSLPLKRSNSQIHRIFSADENPYQHTCVGDLRPDETLAAAYGGSNGEPENSNGRGILGPEHSYSKIPRRHGSLNSREPIPLDGGRASRSLRIQQLDILRNWFALGIIPAWFPATHKELGCFALRSLLFKTCTCNWWLGLIGQFCPKKLISSLKAELSAGDEWEIPAFKDVARHFLDKSLYSIGLCSQLALTSSTSLLLSTEKHGERKGQRSRAMVYHKLPNHDITF